MAEMNQVSKTEKLIDDHAVAVEVYKARSRCVRCNGFHGFENVCGREGCPMFMRYIEHPESWGCIFFADRG